MKTFFILGCEFFKEWKDNSYTGETMKFDWSQVCYHTIILCVKIWIKITYLKTNLKAISDKKKVFKKVER